MKRKSQKLAILLGLFISSASTAQNHSDLWVFGDSFSDVGSTKKILPVLESLSRTYLPKNAKLADGKLWIEYFAEDMGYAHRAASYWLEESRRPGNFSMIAASAKQDKVAIVDFPEQVAAFEKEFERFSASDLVVVQIGINDALEAMKTFGRLKGEIGDRAAFAKGLAGIDEAMKGYEKTFKKLLKLGARSFLVLNSPDLGRAPFAGNLGIRELATKFSLALNEKITRSLSRVDRDDVSIKEFDLFSNLVAILDAPDTVGLQSSLETSAPCGWRGPEAQVCQNPRDFFYYDLNHPTSQVNRIIAEKAFETINR